MFRKDSVIVKEWLENSNKALLVTGARQIGKTWLVRDEIEKSGYNKFEVNFIDQPDMITYLNAQMSAEEFLIKLKMLMPEECKPHNTVVFFDEIQKCPEIVTKIKFLVDEGSFKYVMSGSLLGVELKGIASAPVGYLSVLKMYPMDFEEFCWALNEKPLIPYIRTCFEKRVSLERSLHDKAMLLFKQYLLVGGMPKAVAEFLNRQKNFGAADAEKRDILALYRGDIMKIQAQYRAKVLAIFDQIPGLLSRHEKRVVFNRIAEGSIAEQYEETFFWLSDSMVCNECRRTNDPNVGLSLNESDTYIKCYLGDTGLLVSHAFDENELLEDEVYKQILAGKLGLNEGMLYENMIAQMLTSNGHRLFFYTHYNEEKRRNDIEIDFIISNNSKTKYKMYPIEVKSGTNYSVESLLKFREKFKSRIGECYIIHPRNLTVKEDILCIPPYMTICL